MNVNAFISTATKYAVGMWWRYLPLVLLLSAIDALLGSLFECVFSLLMSRADMTVLMAKSHAMNIIAPLFFGGAFSWPYRLLCSYCVLRMYGGCWPPSCTARFISWQAVVLAVMHVVLWCIVGLVLFLLAGGLFLVTVLKIAPLFLWYTIFFITMIGACSFLIVWLLVRSWFWFFIIADTGASSWQSLKESFYVTRTYRWWYIPLVTLWFVIRFLLLSLTSTAAALLWWADWIFINPFIILVTGFLYRRLKSL